VSAIWGLEFESKNRSRNFSSGFIFLRGSLVSVRKTVFASYLGGDRLGRADFLERRVQDLGRLHLSVYRRLMAAFAVISAPPRLNYGISTCLKFLLAGIHQLAPNPSQCRSLMKVRAIQQLALSWE